jgi:hypothetical protein
MYEIIILLWHYGDKKNKQKEMAVEWIVDGSQMSLGVFGAIIDGSCLWLFCDFSHFIFCARDVWLVL